MTDKFLYLLRPEEQLPQDDNPWEPWYDKTFGFVIRAASEKEARQLAHENADDENRGEFLGRQISKTTSPWLNSKYSSCKKLSTEGETEIIMKDFYSA